MAEKGNTKGCLIGLVVVMGLMVLLFLCSGVAAVVLGPPMLVDAMFEDQPITVTQPGSERTANEIRDAMDAGLAEPPYTVVLTGPELTTLMRDGAKGSGSDLGVSVSNGVATFDMSLKLPDEKDKTKARYLNLHAVGGLVYEDDRVTSASFTDLTFSGWDLDWMLDDQTQLTQQLNQQIAQRRLTDPKFREAMEGIERVAIEGDTVVITVNDKGLSLVRPKAR